MPSWERSWLVVARPTFLKSTNKDPGKFIYFD